MKPNIYCKIFSSGPFFTTSNLSLYKILLSEHGLKLYIDLSSLYWVRLKVTLNLKAPLSFYMCLHHFIFPTSLFSMYNLCILVLHNQDVYNETKKTKWKIFSSKLLLCLSLSVLDTHPHAAYDTKYMQLSEVIHQHGGALR